MTVSRRRFVQSAVAGATAPALIRPARTQAGDTTNNKTNNKTDGISDDTIHLVSTLPLTGPLGQTGSAMAAGMQVVAGRVNAKGGIHGRKLALHILDDSYDVPTAEQNIRAAIERNHLFACIACCGTPVNQRLIPLLERQEIPYVAPFTGSETVRLPDYTHTFHIRAGYRDEVYGLINAISRMGITDIGIVHVANAFGTSLRDVAINALQAHRRRPVSIETVRMDALDVAQSARRTWRSKPSAVFLATSGRISVKVLEELRSVAMQLPIFTTSVGFPPGVQAVLKEKMTGVGIMQIVPNPDKQSIKLVRRFREAMQAAGADHRSATAMEGYINMRVMAQALQRTGKDLNRENLLLTLRSMQRWDVDGYAIDFGNTAPYKGSQYTELGVVSRSGRLI